MLKRRKIKINLFLSAEFIMMVQIKLKAFFLLKVMAVFHFLFLKFMIKYLKQVFHTWNTLLIILIDILLSKSTKKKVQTIFYSTKHWGKKTVLVHLCTTSICLAVKTFIKRVWAIVQQHLPLPEIITAWEALFLVLWKANANTCI